ncbi:hypothetical protein SALBM311S_05779 [Streptomyces alboniger]
METGRALFGLSAAAFVPWGIGWQRSRPWSMVLFTVIYGGYAIWPYRAEEKPLLALIAEARQPCLTSTLYRRACTPWHAHRF